MEETVLNDRYENPLCKRYASKEMQEIFSDDRKFSTWRKLWVILAESEKELGLDITDEQLDEMRAHLYDIDYETARRREAEVRHDVMAHIYTYGLACPKARPIIHLGATSCYVGDNTDIILQRDALLRIRKLLLNAIAATADFAEKYKALPTLAYTHFQAAQPTTVGKRATLWLQDLMLDLEQLDFALGNLKLLGCRGTTGTGASFLSLFGGDHEKVKALEQKVVELIQKYHAKETCVVSSMKYDCLKKVKEADEDIETAYITSVSYGNFTVLQYADGYSVESMMLTQGFVNKAHRNGKEVYVWTVNSEDTLKKVIEMGVDKVITDDPVMAKKLIYEKEHSSFWDEYINRLLKINTFTK